MKYLESYTKTGNSGYLWGEGRGEEGATLCSKPSVLLTFPSFFTISMYYFYNFKNSKKIFK